MKTYITYALALLSLVTNAQAIVTTLTANGPGNTYENINAVFAPNGGNVVEAPGITPSGNSATTMMILIIKNLQIPKDIFRK